MDLIFDLGGVVFDWEPPRLVAELFSEPRTQALVMKELYGHPDWLELDRGTLTWAQAAARGAARTGLAEEALLSLLRRVPDALVPKAATLELLQRLKARGHRLFCLSNMHTEAIAELERRHDLFSLFDGLVISCRVRMIKPEPGIYQLLLARQDLVAKETLFIDDMAENLEAAAGLGLRTLLFLSPARCAADLEELGYL